MLRNQHEDHNTRPAAPHFTLDILRVIRELIAQLSADPDRLLMILHNTDFSEYQ